MKPLIITKRITTRDSDAFKRYLLEVSNIEMLTEDEETFYAEKAALGDEDALNKLIRGNLRFVVSVAKQYSNANAPLEDLVNEGNIGLIEAGKRFDPTKGFKFISYAVWWIRRSVVEYINKNSRAIRIPTNKLNDIYKFNEKVISIEQNLGRTPEVNDIVDAFNGDFNSDEVEFLIKINATNIWSLDRPLSEGSNEVGVSTLIDITEDDGALQADAFYIEDETCNLLNKALNVLKPQQRIIMENLYGLNGKTELPLKEVGALEEVQLTRERVRQIREKALRPLRQRHGKSALRSLTR